ncbi:hypothetical protein shim_09310 [Shimia sp. SK013]|nr:hypothetical protein shim_09310 [Shimia sp. SK013]
MDCKAARAVRKHIILVCHTDRRNANVAAGMIVKERLSIGQVVKAKLKYPITRERGRGLNYRLRTEQENTDLVLCILTTAR